MKPAGAASALTASLILFGMGADMGCGPHTWPSLWHSYTAAFMDDQVRVIDHDAADRTTSEAQAYAMFFALVANDRSRFDGLLGWTERNLASGDLTRHLPAWLWGHSRSDPNRWGVLDANSASDADVWMAYTLLEAGFAWKEPRYTELGSAVADRIAATETADLPELGVVLLPGASGFRHGESVRLNASYLPPQLVLRLAQVLPSGPWRQIADRAPLPIRDSSPNGFPTDWIEYVPGEGVRPSQVGSYDAIRVYLWAGMLDRSAPGREVILRAISGMAERLRNGSVPPARVAAIGQDRGHQRPHRISAALLPYLAALDETRAEREQMSRLKSAADPKTGLYGAPARYYDQNLALFGIVEREFRFDANGALHTRWNDDH